VLADPVRRGARCADGHPGLVSRAAAKMAATPLVGAECAWLTGRLAVSSPPIGSDVDDADREALAQFVSSSAG
jgi:hypothetical protein